MMPMKIDKKHIVEEIMKTEKGLKTEEVMQDLYWNQVLASVVDKYYMELLYAIFQYDRVSVCNLLDHLFDNYAKIDYQLLKTNRELYTEAPDLSKLINIYFRKQEKYMQMAVENYVPIREAYMVLQFQMHLAKKGMVNSDYKKWKTSQPPVTRGR